MSAFKALEIKFKGEDLLLLPQKAIYWKSKETLIVSDIHLTKSGHFRKHGIAVPEDVNTSNLDRLSELVKLYEPKKLLVLGDLFHSVENEELNSFKQWREEFQDLEILLTSGNHDILPASFYDEMSIINAKRIDSKPFLFVHEIEKFEHEAEQSNLYMIGGHVHPCVFIRGKGRQSVRFPVFYFGERAGLLPAFGSFTGMHTIKPKLNELTFGIVENQVISI